MRRSGSGIISSIWLCGKEYWEGIYSLVGEFGKNYRYRNIENYVSGKWGGLFKVEVGLEGKYNYSLYFDLIKNNI